MNTQRMPVNTLAALDMQTILKKKKTLVWRPNLRIFFFLFFVYALIDRLWAFGEK